MAKLNMWASGLCTGAAIASFINGGIFFGIYCIASAILLFVEGLND